MGKPLHTYKCGCNTNGLENIREAKTKIESALDEATKVTAVKDTNRLQIDFFLHHVTKLGARKAPNANVTPPAGQIGTSCFGRK